MMRSEEPDYYRILQVRPDAEQEVVEAAYKRLAKKYHPHTNKGPAAAARMTKLNIAYETIGDRRRRRDYDSRRRTASSADVRASTTSSYRRDTQDNRAATPSHPAPSFAQKPSTLFVSRNFIWIVSVGAIAAFWAALALSTQQYFVALGALFFIGVALLIDLPASSSEEASADEEKSGPF